MCRGGASRHDVNGCTGLSSRAVCVSPSSTRWREPYSPNALRHSRCRAASSGASANHSARARKSAERSERPGATLVEARDNGEKIGDRLAGAAAQQLRLAWVAGLGDEPLAQALPALAPCCHAGAIGELARIALVRGSVFTPAVTAARGGVLRVAAGHDAEQTHHLAILKIVQQSRDLRADGDQILDEALQVVDEPILVGEESVHVRRHEARSCAATNP